MRNDTESAPLQFNVIGYFRNMIQLDNDAQRPKTKVK